MQCIRLMKGGSGHEEVSKNTRGGSMHDFDRIDNSTIKFLALAYLVSEKKISCIGRGKGMR